MTSVDSERPDNSETDPAPPDALIIGHYGFKNLGDEAILTGMLTLLRDKFPDGRWTVASGDPDDTRRRHGVAGGGPDRHPGGSCRRRTDPGW